ncbi:hypothetical protein FRC19_004349 [Serendipita sp. 401]|nr:hypothetical protein FRC19_004349 [Serendipita sp. 401]KAG9036304.1 hypothetical protein FS842_003454 [Serendipita sp. 407]
MHSVGNSVNIWRRMAPKKIQELNRQLNAIPDPSAEEAQSLQQDIQLLTWLVEGTDFGEVIAPASLAWMAVSMSKNAWKLLAQSNALT